MHTYVYMHCGRGEAHPSRAGPSGQERHAPRRRAGGYHANNDNNTHDTTTTSTTTTTNKDDDDNNNDNDKVKDTNNDINETHNDDNKHNDNNNNDNDNNNDDNDDNDTNDTTTTNNNSNDDDNDHNNNKLLARCRKDITLSNKTARALVRLDQEAATIGDCNGDTAIHMAAEAGRLDTLRTLVGGNLLLGKSDPLQTQVNIPLILLRQRGPVLQGLPRTSSAFSGFRGPGRTPRDQAQDSSKGGAVETGCSDLYAVIYQFTM